MEVDVAVEVACVLEVPLFDLVVFAKFTEFWGSIKFKNEISTVFSQYWVIAIALSGPYLVSKTILYLMPWTTWYATDKVFLRGIWQC